MGRLACCLFLALMACGPQEGVQDREGKSGLKDILPPTPAETAASADARQADARPVGPLVATLQGTPEHPGIRGTVRLVPGPNGVEVQSAVEGLPAGAHGYHVHMYGDCSAATAKSPGPHLDFASLGTGRQMGPLGGTAVDRTSPPGHVLHSDEPKAQADGQLVGQNGTGTPSTPPGSAPTSGAQGVGGSRAGAEADVRGVGNPGAAPAGNVAQGTAGAPGSPGTEQSASNSSAGATSHPGGAPAAGVATSGSQSGPGAGHTVAGAPAAGHVDHVLGNLGELMGIEGQPAQANGAVTQLTSANLEHLVGRAVVIHERPNDPNAPDGAAGSPIACGVIGLANPSLPPTGANMTAPTPDTRTGSNRSNGNGSARNSQ